MNLPVPTVISQKETPKKLKGKKKAQTFSLSDALLHAYGTWVE